MCSEEWGRANQQLQKFQRKVENGAVAGSCANYHYVAAVVLSWEKQLPVTNGNNPMEEREMMVQKKEDRINGAMS